MSALLSNLHLVSAEEEHAVTTVECAGHTVHFEQTVLAVPEQPFAWNSSSAHVVQAVHCVSAPAFEHAFSAKKFVGHADVHVWHTVSVMELHT